ncbi:hypothetical protein K9L16_03280 [Candidatus Pacearchaeota archaeon]|nr:hypothetical protein [Candidatus Pacearchaeota archaeon]
MLKTKRGQFYLIAALIIIAVLIGFATTFNFAESIDRQELYDLGEELKIESELVLDYGVYQKLNDEGMDNLLLDFTEIYTQYKGDARDLFFAFGDQDRLTIAGYTDPETNEEELEEIRKTVILKIPGEGEVGTLEIINSDNYTATSYDLNKNKEIILNVDGINYYFTLGRGEYFYFIIAQKIGGEYYIFTNEES